VAQVIVKDTDIQAALAWTRGRRAGLPKSRLCELLLNSHRFGGGGGGSTDPNFANVELLLPGDGVAGSTSITDSSSFARAITVSGNAQHASSASAFGGSAIQLDGTGDYVTAGVAADWSWMHQTGGIWSMEMRLKPNNFAATNSLFSTSNGTTANQGIACAITAARQIAIDIYRGVVGSFVLSYLSPVIFPNDTASFTTVLMTWDQTLAANNLNIFVNGALVATASKTANAPGAGAATTALRIGTQGIGGTDFNGMVEEVRVTKNVIRQSANYSVATAAFPTSA
jgi:hypothetical protein